MKHRIRHLDLDMVKKSLIVLLFMIPALGALDQAPEKNSTPVREKTIGQRSIKRAPGRAILHYPSPYYLEGQESY